jgi:hypothetical protein
VAAAVCPSGPTCSGMEAGVLTASADMRRELAMNTAGASRSDDGLVALICPLCGVAEMGKPGRPHRGLELHPPGGVPMRPATAQEVERANAEFAARVAAERMQAVTPG